MFCQRIFPAFWKQYGCLAQRFAHTSSQTFSVTVVGGGGGIGQPLSLLLKRNPLVSRLTVFDIKNAVGVAADLSHIDTPGPVKGFDCLENLTKALACTDIIVVSAGMPRKPGQTRDDLFKVNAEVIAAVADAMAHAAPNAYLTVITNPVNSTVPVAAEILKKHNKFNPARVFGITTLDIVRSRKFISEFSKIPPAKIKIDVIGGHSAETIIPLISSSDPEFKGDDDDIVKLTNRIKNAGTEVVEAKAGAGSATLSMAHAGAEFVNSLLRGLSGQKGVTDIAFVETCSSEAPFFAAKLQLGEEGIAAILDLPRLSNYESELMCAAMPILLADIKKGIEFGKGFKISEPKKDC